MTKKSFSDLIFHGLCNCLIYQFPIVLLILAVCTCSSFAADENFSGTWYLTAGQTRYMMELTQMDTRVFGNMFAINANKRLPIIVYGTANGGLININANNRDSTQVLTLKGVIIGKGAEKAIVGDLTINNRHNLKFVGLR